MKQQPPVGPVTKHAVLGTLYGLVAGTTWGALTSGWTIPQGAFGGFVGGLVGGTVWGLLSSWVFKPRR